MSFLEEGVPEQFPLFYNGIEVVYIQITRLLYIVFYDGRGG
jgi:hypothetical protein